MSNIQNRFNQLIQSASYYTSINSALRDKQAEASALRTSVKRAEKADKATESITAADDIKAKEIIKDPEIRAAFNDREKGKAKLESLFSEGNARRQVRSEALRNKESAYENVFLQNPSEQTYSDYQGAMKARMEFENRASQSVKQLQEFFNFWDELDETIGKQTYHEAYSYFDKSTPVGGSK